MTVIKAKYVLILFLCFTLNAHAQTNNKVLLIGMDGTRSDALQFANTPHLDSLISTGYYCPDALNDDITISGPGWSAILTGVRSDKHLVVENDFSPNDYEHYPSIIRRIESVDTNYHTASICHWFPINNAIVGPYGDYRDNYSSDFEVANAAANYLLNNDPDFLFLHFDDPDHAGHGYGFSTSIPEYVSAIAEVDSFIGIVMEGLVSRSNYDNENWLILVTTDHGGIGTSHGGTTIEEQHIFVIASGDSVPTELDEAPVVGGNPDYSNTPRLEDIPVTALTHMCIFVDDTWLLDGESLVIANCAVLDSTSTGIKDFVDQRKYTIYPNPTSGTFRVECDNCFEQKTTVQVFNQMGQLMLSRRVKNNNDIDCSKLSAGTYIVLIANGNWQEKQRLVIYK